MAFIVPPGGPAGFRQMTPASRAALFPRGRSGSTSTRRRKRSKTKARRRSSSAKRPASGKLPKFGSPAWRKKFGLDKKRRKK